MTATATAAHASTAWSSDVRSEIRQLNVQGRVQLSRTENAQKRKPESKAQVLSPCALKEPSLKESSYFDREKEQLSEMKAQTNQRKTLGMGTSRRQALR